MNTCALLLLALVVAPTATMAGKHAKNTTAKKTTTTTATAKPAPKMAVKHTGSFTIKVSNASAFKTNPKVKVALQEAVADTLPGVEKEHVTITGISDAVRRLAEGRMLGAHGAAGSVKVDYEINLPATYSGAPVTTASITAALVPATLMEKINTRVAAAGLTSVTVTHAPVVGAVTTVKVVPTTTNTTKAATKTLPTASGAAMSSLAAFSAMTMVLAHVA